MRARYIGDPNNEGEGRKVLRLFGIAFPKDKWVSIDGNAAALLKLPNNSHFEVDAGKAEASLAPPPAPSAPVKNKGGRPRKNPLPEPKPEPKPEAADDDLAELEEKGDDGFSDLDD